MEEVNPGNNDRIISYIIGLDSIKATSIDNSVTLGIASEDIRLRMDGLFANKEHAIQFTKEFTALYTNGPAGGGGISTGYKKEIVLEKAFIKREDVYVHVGSKKNNTMDSYIHTRKNEPKIFSSKIVSNSCQEFSLPQINTSPAGAGQTIPLYIVAHSRAGDKGNDLNFSIIPHFLPDINRLKVVITPNWVKSAIAPLLNPSSFPDSEAIRKRDEWVSDNVKVEIYEVKGISSLNVVVRNILDGGVNCSRRIDRHGKSISDLVLSQLIVLP